MVIRTSLVAPMIEKMAAWLRRQLGVTVKNVILKARVPIVTFVTDKMEVCIDWYTCTCLCVCI